MAIADTVAVGAVVLCGGVSRRMGRAKALLPFGHETMLQRTVRVLAQRCAPLVVVAAAGQRLPPLGAGQVVRDPVAGRGPLQGVATGLAALAGEVRSAFVCATDLPLLRVALVDALLVLRGEHNIVVPRVGGHDHVLAGLYDTSLCARADVLLQQRERRAHALFGCADTRFASAEELLSHADLSATDPQLQSLRNVNTPDDYAAALRAAGIPGAG